MKTTKYPMPTMSDTSKYSNMNEHDVVALYNEHVNDVRNVNDDESASKYVDVMLPIICRLGELRVGCRCKGRMRNFVMTADYFTDCRTRKIANLNKRVAAAFKKHGWCTSVRCSPIHINDFLGKDDNVADEDVKITRLDTPAPVATTTNEDDILAGIVLDDTKTTSNNNDFDVEDLLAGLDLGDTPAPAPSKKTTKKTTKKTAKKTTKNVAPVAPAPVATTTEDDKYIARASVSTSNDNDMYSESALYDVLGGYEVVNEQVADVAVDEQVANEVVEDEQENTQNVHTYSMDNVSAEDIAIDEIGLYAILYGRVARYTPVYTPAPAPQQQVVHTPKNESRQGNNESVWTRLRHFLFGYTDNEIAAMHAAA